MGRIVSFGETLIDFLDLSTVKEQAGHFLRQAGGAPANVAVVVAKLGGASSFVGMIAKDMFGDFLIQHLIQFGVDTRHVCRTTEAPTALAFVSLNAQGERTFSFYRPPAADMLFSKENFERACFEDCSVFHVCSISMTDPALAQVTRYGMQQASLMGALVSFDVNLRPALWPKNADPHQELWKALALADIVKLAQNELEYLAHPFNDQSNLVIQKILSQRARLVLITDGENSVRYFTSTREGHHPAFSVKAVDTTAAGDAFIGGLLYWLTEHDIDLSNFDQFLNHSIDFKQALNFSCACGALTVKQKGAFNALPTLNAVKTFLMHPT